MTKTKTNRKLKKDNIVLLILTFTFIILMLIIGKMTLDIFKKDNKEVKEVQIVDKLDDYGYYLTENNTKYYKKLYEELKKVLANDTINEEDYASMVAKMFVADFYDLNSKTSKSDVGGVQFVYQTYQETFIKFATDSNGIYYYVQSNLDGKRKQELPIVTNVEVTNVKPTTFVYGQIKDDKAYNVTVKITYEKPLGYDTDLTLTIIHNKNKLEVAVME